MARIEHNCLACKAVIIDNRILTICPECGSDSITNWSMEKDEGHEFDDDSSPGDEEQYDDNRSYQDEV
jgi:predicted  nucleic acid-binding Zn-ribbon protein